MNVLLITFVAAVTAFAPSEYEAEFKAFLTTHNKVYEGDELNYRFGIFKASMDEVARHNAANNEWTKGINQFSDLTEAEFRRIYLGYLHRPRKLSIEPVVEVDAPTEDIDWRGKGALTPIKNQGQCGSCWAFSSTGGLEGAQFVASGKIQSLSEQTLVDCSGSYGNKGCNGGLMDNAFKYVKAKGIASESAYPYTAKDGSCKQYTSVQGCSSFTDVSGGSSGLAKALAGQPISVAVDASKWSSYRSGVFSCSGRPQLDHGVLLVGSFDQYWVIKNSWGASWGMSGFIQLSKTNDCGVTQDPSYPTV